MQFDHSTVLTICFLTTIMIIGISIGMNNQQEPVEDDVEEIQEEEDSVEDDDEYLEEIPEEYDESEVDEVIHGDDAFVKGSKNVW
jgi:hypothetical protein